METIPAETAATEGRVAVDVRSIALSVLAVIGFILMLRFAQEFFLPAVAGCLIAYALNPLVTLVTRLRVPRVIAAAVVLLALVGGMSWGAYALRHQLVASIATIPEAAQRLRAKMREWRAAPADPKSALSTIQEAATEIEKTAAAAAGETKGAPRGVAKVQIEEPAFRASDYLWFGSIGMMGLTGQAMMMLFLVFFLLASGDFFKRKLVHVLGTTLSEKRLTLEGINEINAQIERFLLVQVAMSALVGFCTSMALWMMGVRQPAVWGLAAGILNSIPYFGAILATAGLALVAFVQSGSLEMAFQVGAVALVITSLEGYLLTPWLMGRAARINGVAMFLGLLFWSWLWGIVGMIVAVPLMMVIKSVCDRVERLQPVGELLGE